jgi:hypothetical protein
MRFLSLLLWCAALAACTRATDGVFPSTSNPNAAQRAGLPLAQLERRPQTFNALRHHDVCGPRLHRVWDGVLTNVIVAAKE